MKIWLLRRRHSLLGGAERFTSRLAACLHSKGHEIWILAEKWPESPDGSYQVETVPGCGLMSFSKGCHARLAGRKDGLIFSLERTSRQHIFRAGDGLHAAWLERRGRFQNGMKRLWASWSKKHRNLLDLEKLLLLPHSTDWIVANSPMVKREILEKSSFPQEKIKVISPGVNLSVFKPCLDVSLRQEYRQRLGVPRGAVIWCFVGSGFERKGLEWAIQIAAAQKEEIWLLVLGKGRTTPYERVADKVGFTQRLVFAPMITPALEIYHASDAFILPTIYDPCSNATLEAAACGLPVITTTGNGAAEWVPSLALDDPSNTAEAAERCAIFARPLMPSALNVKLTEVLDEAPCWEAMHQLVDVAGRGTVIS